jgi:hypothetical protein
MEGTPVGIHSASLREVSISLFSQPEINVYQLKRYPISEVSNSTPGNLIELITGEVS